MEQLEYNLLLRWFVGLGMDDPVWVATGWKGKPRRRGSDDDPGNPTVNFRGERRSNATHQSTMDPEARLAKKKGPPSRLSYVGHVLAENRHGLVVEAQLTQADGYAEREMALAMLERIPGRRRITLGADKGYDAADFMAGCRERNVTPHVTQNLAQRSSRIDARTTGQVGYQLSQRKRSRIEEVFGWMKTIGLMRKTRHKGRRRVGWIFTFTAAAYNDVLQAVSAPLARLKRQVGRADWRRAIAFRISEVKLAKLKVCG